MRSVKVPELFEPIFKEAEKYVSSYFKDLKLDPTRGIIEVRGERYILVRAEAMSYQFLDFMKSMYPSMDSSTAFEASSRILYDMAKSFGNSDADRFHKTTAVQNPIQKLSTGPIHFAYTGWAFVDIHPESIPSADENYYLQYDHPYSFEADSWIKAGRKTESCTCFMNAGYSSGWCEKSFGISLEAREILCRAKGDSNCRFIMSQPHRLEEFIEKYKNKEPV
jgi:predicted hydrocarbon binding protein